MSSSDSSSDSNSSSDSDSSSDSGSIHDHPGVASYDLELDVSELEQAADETYDEKVGIPLQMWEDAMGDTGREISNSQLLLKSQHTKPGPAFSNSAELYEGLYDAEVLDQCVPLLELGPEAFRGYQKRAQAYLQRQEYDAFKEKLQLINEKIRMYLEQAETYLTEFRQRRSENLQKVERMKTNRNTMIYEQLLLKIHCELGRLDVEPGVLKSVTDLYWKEFTWRQALEEMKAVVQRATPKGAPAS